MGFWDYFKPKPKTHVTVGDPEPYLGNELYELSEAARRQELVRRYHDEQRRKRRQPRVVDGVDDWMSDK